MKTKAAISLAAAVLVLGLGLPLALGQEKHKDNQIDTGRIVRKLDQVLKNQETIFQQFSEIKQELNVIRIRASR